MIDKAVISYLDAGTYTYFDPDKFYPIGTVPQLTATPYAFFRVGGTETTTSKGNTSHINETLFRVNVISKLIGTCYDWHDEIKSRLDGIINTTSAGIVIRQIRYDDMSYIWNDSYDAFEMVIDFTITTDV